MSCSPHLRNYKEGASSCCCLSLPVSATHTPGPWTLGNAHVCLVSKEAYWGGPTTLSLCSAGRMWDYWKLCHLGAVVEVCPGSATFGQLPLCWLPARFAETDTLVQEIAREELENSLSSCRSLVGSHQSREWSFGPEPGRLVLVLCCHSCTNTFDL